MSRPTDDLGALPILTYHAIADRVSPTSTTVDRFRTTMERLRDHGWSCLGLDDWIERERPPVSRSFALTFDDGLRSILRIVDVLTDLQLPATLFVITGHADLADRQHDESISDRSTHKDYLSWSELRDLVDSGIGMTIGSHTVTHPDLRTLTIRRVQFELSDSRARIEDRLEAPCPFVAYPFGSVDDRVVEASRAVYRAGFGTRLGLADGSEDPHRLSRFESYYLNDDAVLDRFCRVHLEPWMTARRGLRTIRDSATRAVYALRTRRTDCAADQPAA